VRADVREALSLALSPCIEWLFADGGRPFADRVGAAVSAGFTNLEFWTARDKDLVGLEQAIRESGVTVSAFVSEPTGSLVDPATHDRFLDGVVESARLAGRLGARGLIVVSGDSRAGVTRPQQHDAIVQALRRAAPVAADAGVGLLLEPLNTLVDHKGYFLDSTAEAMQIVREVAHPAVKVLYDLYHSVVMGEDPASVLTGRGDLVGHVHIADVPGRHEPGTGEIDWRAQLATLRSAGYRGPIGLEYRPTGDTLSSLAYVRGLA
jgi:hydroxypyruvate isomerase